jgi:hypothetical protein
MVYSLEGHFMRRFVSDLKQSIVIGFLCLSWIWLAISLANAAEIGRVEIDGVEVILLDDNTWQYANDGPVAKAGPCTSVESEILPVSLCLHDGKWGFANLGGDAEIKLKVNDEELYLLVITEKTVIKLPDLKKAALGNAQSASGLTKVQVIEDGSAIIDGHGFGKLVYATKVDGIDITYANYYTSFPDEGSLQFVFFAATDQFPDMKDLISEAVSSVKVSK